MNFIWSTGEKYNKSYKNDKIKYLLSESIEINSNNTNDKIGKFNLEPLVTKQVVGLKNNRREQANEKMNERHLICQTHQNPFLAENNYVKDLDNQSKFLIPRTQANNPNYAEL